MEESAEGFELPFRFGEFGTAHGSTALETKQVHGGKKSARLSWDNGKNKPGIAGSTQSTHLFYYQGAQARLPGEPVSLSLWVYADPPMAGTPVRIYFMDATGERFASKPLETKEGWSQLTFSAAEMSSLANLGKAVVYPVNFLGLSAGDPKSKGSLVIDDLELTTKGDPRKLVDAKFIWQNGVFAWGKEVKFRLDLANRSPETFKSVAANLVIVDVLTGKNVWEKKYEMGSLEGKKNQSQIVTPDIPCGVYDLKWELTDSAGALGTGGNTVSPIRFARMAGDASGSAADRAEKDYVRNWGLIGGVYWSTPLDLAQKTGASWERLGGRSHWRDLEHEAGTLDIAPAIESVQTDVDKGLGIVYLNTITEGFPDFYATNQEQFARKYGILSNKEAAAFANKVALWEFGNEDNGTAKYIYTEIARNGAAGVRSESATTLLGTTGTASVDIGFMRVHAARGLFDRLDAVITHPYTWASSPEGYGLGNQFGQVNELIDDLGGMKIQLTTEFGYPIPLDPLRRAQWVPRNYAIAASEGLYRHGLYAFDNEFGMYYGIDYIGTSPFPVAASLNAYAFLTYGYHFAGWFEKSDRVWASIYDKGGKSVLMAWSPPGGGTLKLSATTWTKSGEIRDLFGNVMPNPVPSADGNTMDIPVNESPVYISNLGNPALAQGYANELEKARTRYAKCLSASELKSDPAWKALAEGKVPDSSMLRKALLEWKPAAKPVSKTEQAVIAQALRWLEISTHADAVTAASSAEKTKGGDTRASWTALLTKSVSADVDLPALRWLLNQWNQTRDEMAMLKESNQLSYVSQLATLEPVYDQVAGQLAEHGSQIFFPIWPYLHAPSGDGKLVEHFIFVPGKAVPVKVRLQSYSKVAYEGEVTLDLPAGWKSEPASWKGKMDPASLQEVDFAVIAGNEAGAKSLNAVLTIPGKPVVRIPFDDFFVLPPVEIRVPVLTKLLPDTALPLQITNNGNVPLAATVRLVAAPNTPPLAKAKVETMAPGESRTVEMALPKGEKAPAFHEWNLIAEVATSDGKNFQVPLSTDFGIAVHTDSAPKIDGDLSDWQSAAPLHIDQESYTQGSYPTGWSKEDESGVVYTKWEDQNFYIAVHVRDQTFQQALSGADVWAQDGVQFCLVTQDKQRHQFALTETPKGPELWSNRRSALVTDGKIKVVVKPGEVFYEAAIPWSEMPGVKPTVGQDFGFDVLLNDDDAIVRRRYMERYGINIVSASDSAKLGTLHLGETSPETAAPVKAEADKGKLIFHEDFEQYAAGEMPETWTPAGAPNPGMSLLVKEGSGIDGSKCLEFIHTEPQQGGVFIVLTRSLSGLTQGKKYRLSFKVKGEGSNPSGVLTAVGTCLDLVGAAGYNWSATWKPSNDWQEVTTEWTSVGGDFRAIIRNTDIQAKSLLIDDIKITELP